jgi:uncharacterized protein DUF6931
MTDDLTRITARFAAEVGKDKPLSPEALALLDATVAPRPYLDRLRDAGLYLDLITFLAHALPKREAVWWGCRCVRMAVGPEPKPEVADALKAAETWAAAPGDVNRRKAYPAAEAAGFAHPAGSVAVAAFFSGGSLAPPNLKEVPPADHLTGTCVAAAVQTAAVLNEPAKADDAYQAFLAVGLEVARGKDRWKDNL